MELEHGDVVLCTVDRIVGTTVFVNISGVGEGKIILSEIAPGRIRNLREYVVPKKTIICKVLRISGNNIELSLRRVTPKEKKQVLEQHKLEKSYKSILKSVLKEKTEDILKKILEKQTLYAFLEDAKQDSNMLESTIGKTDSEKVLEILNSQKQKKSIIKKHLMLHSTDPDGLDLIKKILEKSKDIEIKYISAGKYSLKTESEDLKKADQKIKDFFDDLEKQVREKAIEISLK
jgi:translation initiation factor 2 alpha subunit (eIF-2alpha)